MQVSLSCDFSTLEGLNMIMILVASSDNSPSKDRVHPQSLTSEVFPVVEGGGVCSRYMVQCHICV